ncbi:MAG: hypothetical protein U0165_06005 [Polyangiaceae bacterium]
MRNGSSSAVNADNVPIYDAGIRVYPGTVVILLTVATLGMTGCTRPTRSSRTLLLDVQVKLKGCQLVSGSSSSSTTVVVAPSLDSKGLRGTGAESNVDVGNLCVGRSLDPITVQCGSSATFTLTSVPSQLEIFVSTRTLKGDCRYLVKLRHRAPACQ